MKLVLLVVVALWITLITGECAVTISQIPRSSWSSSDSYTIYDVTLTNTANNPIMKLVLSTQTPLSQFWNMDVTLEGYAVPSFVTAVNVGMAPGNSFTWGYISLGNTPAIFTVQDIRCSTLPEGVNQLPPPTPTGAPPANPTPVPSSPAATPAPTKAATQPAATQAPTKAATQPAATQAPTKAATPTPTNAATPSPTTKSATPAPPGSSATSAPTTGASLWVDVAKSLSYSPAPSKTAAYYGSAPSGGFCTGTPKMYKGKLCATTTRYYDGYTGACGCGSGDTNPLPFQSQKYTAAASAPIFGYTGWCGRGCGKCFNLTTTGYSPQGRGAAVGQSIVAMVTNLCPPQDPWCSNGLSSYNYLGHFDLMDANMNGLISQLGWDNAEVTFEQVPCAGAPLTPTASDFSKCQCAAK